MQCVEMLEDSKNYYMVCEKLGGGDLTNVIKANKGADVAREVLYQVLLALNYFHKKGMTHRDLKPDNILLV